MNETDLLKLKSLNACPECDLSGAELVGASLDYADLTGADLSNADLSCVDLSEGMEDPGLDPSVFLMTTTLRNAKLDGVKYWKTKMPWGEVSDELVVSVPDVPYDE